MGQQHATRSPLLASDAIEADIESPLRQTTKEITQIVLPMLEQSPCEICEAAHDATFSCADCKLKVCTAVCERLHKKGLKNHKLTPLPGAEVPCEVCEEKHRAFVVCADCQLNECEKVSNKLHQSGPFRKHRLSQLIGGLHPEASELELLKSLLLGLSQIFPDVIAPIIVSYWGPSRFMFYGPKFSEAAGMQDSPKLYLQLSPLPAPIQRLTLQMTWVDQAWGNRQGACYVRLVRNNDVVVEEKPFGIAEHHVTTPTVTLDSSSPIIQQSRCDDVLQFWRYIGGGGGHTLTISKFAGLIVT